MAWRLPDLGRPAPAGGPANECGAARRGGSAVAAGGCAPPAVPPNGDQSCDTDPPGARGTPNRHAAVLLAATFAIVWFVSTAMAAHLPRLLQACGVGLAAAVAIGALVGPAQVAGRLLEFGVLRRLHPLLSARLAALAHPVGALALLLAGAPLAPLFAVLHGAGNGILTIAKGTLPLALFGPAGYGARQGLLMVPSRFAQALAPVLFGLCLDRWGAGALWVSTALGLARLRAADAAAPQARGRLRATPDPAPAARDWKAVSCRDFHPIERGMNGSRFDFLRISATAALALLLAACATRPVAVPDPARLSDEQSRNVTVYALGLVGTPYRYGGNTPESGFDCSGLIGHVYQLQAGLAAPRTVASLQGWGQPVPASQLRAGDLVLFGNGGAPTHAGIYVDEGRFVHAPSSGGQVRMDRLDARHWARQQMAYRRP